jgi:hypothetical protein
MWLLHNFLHPVMRLQRIWYRADGRLARTYDLPRPALGRLCLTAALEPQRQAALIQLRQPTSPLELHNQVHSLLDRLSRLPRARPGKTQESTAPSSIRVMPSSPAFLQ